jgi:uncharacterized membrane protein
VKRFACAAYENGESAAAIRNAVEECFSPDDAEEKCECSRIRTLIEQALLTAAAIIAIIVLLRALPALLSIMTRALPLFAIRFLPAAASRFLPGGLQQLPNLGRIIEGEFTVLGTQTMSLERTLRLAAAAARPGLIP